MNLLIVDDTPTNLKLLRAQLEGEGHAVFEAHDGVDALALLERQCVDVVISDIFMPRMDGYRLCYEIRKHARLHDLPIILCTSTYTSPDDEKLVRDVGANKYLKRPVSLETLVAALHEVIAQPHAAPRPEVLQEVEVLKEYSERLVNKMEEKNTELMAAEVKFRTLVEHSIVGIYIIQDDQFVYVNPRMAGIFGRSEAELTSRTLYDFIVPEDHAVTRENIRKRISGGVPILPYSLRVLHQSGAVLQVEIHANRTDYNGRPAVMGTLLDITEHKRAEESLRQSEQRFRTIFETEPECVKVLGINGALLEMNAAGLAMLEAGSVDEVKSRSLGKFILPEYREAFGALHQRAMGGKNGLLEFEVAGLRGTRRWLETHAAPMRDADGRVTMMLGVTRDITERKRAEEAAQRSQKRLRDLIDGLGPSMFVGLMTPQGILIEANRPALAAAGLKPEDVLGKPFEETYWWAYSQEVQQQLREAIARAARGEASRYDVQVRAAENHLIDADFSLQPLRDETGEVVFLVPSASVITERKQTENALRASEEKFRGLFESSRDAIMTLESPSWSFASGNPATMKMFGAKNEEEFISLGPWELSPEQQPDGRASAEQAREMIETAMREGSHFFEWRHRRIGGEEFPANVLLTRMEQGGKVILQATVRDITEQKQAEAEIQNLNAELEQRVQERTAELLTANGTLADFKVALDEHAIVAITDTSGRITYANDKFCAISKYSREELMGQDHRIINSGHHPQAFMRELWETITSGRVWKGEIKNRAKDGTFYWVDSTIGPILHTGEEPSQYIAIRTDITESKRVEEQLVQAREVAETANRAKSDFLASMSHELRTPLNGILGMNELLMNTELTERQRQFVEACSTSGETLLQQINDILDLSKIEAGKMELDLHECPLEALMYDIADVFSHSAQQKGYRLHCHIDPSAGVTALCDGNRLRQILANLIGNAMKFTTSGAVTIRAECVPQHDRQSTLRFSVTDTGVGIPADRRDRLFAPFSQVDSSTSRKFGGTGLGLSICKQLVELMGGQIGVESQLGVGSTFWFEVPLQLAAADATIAQRRHLLAGKRVLAVDGIDRERRQIGDSLQAWECPFEQVSTVPEALETVARAEAAGAPFAVVLADCRLVVGDEYALLQKLATQSRLPIIGLGTNPDDESIAYLRQLGVRHVLRDPVRPSTLFNALTSVLAITSPTASPNQKSDAATDQQPTTFSGHILVAEDNHINQMFVTELLKHCGCTCDIANNGDEALTALQQESYNLILMDCQMPEMDGFTASREIRRREAVGELPGRLPIIALTANALKGDRERCLDAGMDDYLSKPLNAAQLRAKLAKYLAPPSTEGNR